MAGSDLACADSPISHEWGFTPAVSLWIDCESDAELARLTAETPIEPRS